MDVFSQLLYSNDTQQKFREIIKQLGHMVYDEIYLYVWFICFYNVLLLFIVVFTLYLLMRSYRRETLAFSSL
jgi:hypothetical protein